MIRRGGTAPDYADVELCDFIRYIAKSSFPDVNLPESDDDLCEIMPELLLSGNDTDEGFLALFYMAAWAFAENREMLKAYEDTGLSPEAVEQLKLAGMGKAVAEVKEFEGVPIERLRELAAADRKGRVETVVRCQHCNHLWRGSNGACWCDEYGGTITPNDFCSRADTNKEED